jgi:hypothetical protein
VLDPSILKTERPARHLISTGARPLPEHHLARSALPRERVRSVTHICRRSSSSSPAEVAALRKKAKENTAFLSQVLAYLRPVGRLPAPPWTRWRERSYFVRRTREA